MMIIIILSSKSNSYITCYFDFVTQPKRVFKQLQILYIHTSHLVFNTNRNRNRLWFNKQAAIQF